MSCKYKHTFTRKHTHFMKPTHRSVEHAFPVHADVEPTLQPLNGHDSQTHRDEVKQGCSWRETVIEHEGRRERERDRDG